MILLLDNYDSFVFNVARYFQRLGQATAGGAQRCDRRRRRAAGCRPKPSSSRPALAHPTRPAARWKWCAQLHDRLPILGICLGHQAIAAALGGQIVRAAEPMHGRTSSIYHDGRGVFAGIANPTIACRYHSLVIEEASLPDCLQVTARTPRQSGDGDPASPVPGGRIAISSRIDSDRVGLSPAGEFFDHGRHRRADTAAGYRVRARRSAFGICAAGRPRDVLTRRHQLDPAIASLNLTGTP